MRIAKVLGTVTLNRCHPSYRGANLKLVAPFSLQDILEQREPEADTLVAWDSLGAGVGSVVALSEGPEASQPFRPDIKPIEAGVAAILDQLNIDLSLARRMLESNETKK